MVEIETLWTVGGEYPDHWPTPADGWTLTIEGEPSMRAHFLSLASYERDVPMVEHVRSASIATAMQAVNAIPALCEAGCARCGPGSTSGSGGVSIAASAMCRVCRSRPEVLAATPAEAR